MGGGTVDRGLTHRCRQSSSPFPDWSDLSAMANQQANYGTVGVG